jgi:hypothetical protein
MNWTDKFPLVKAGEEYPNYSSFSYVRTSGSPIYSFKDFYFGIEGKETYLKGKWFLMPSGYHYHHFIKEMLAPFLYYKNNIDDSIKILWIDQPNESPTGQNMDLVNSEMKDLLSSFGIEIITHAELNNGKLMVDELITFAVGPRFLFNNMLDFIKHYCFGNTGYYHFPEGNQELRKFFTPYMLEDKSKPKKIFVTRKDANSAIEKNKRQEDFNDRYESHEFLTALEDYFSEQGYTILSLSGMSLFDQISYFYNAEVVAGSPGSNICNLIYSKPDVPLIQVIHFTNYSYPWEEEFNSVISPQYRYIDVVGCIGYTDTMQRLRESGIK